MIVLCFRLLAETGDSVELVEASEMVPGLKFRRGVSNWIVSDKFGNLYKNFSEVPEKAHTLLRPSMFPPPKEESAKYNLVRNQKGAQMHLSTVTVIGCVGS